MLQTMLDEEPEPEYPKVNVDLVYPNALTPQEVNNVFEQFTVKHEWLQNPCALAFRLCQLSVN